MLLLDQVEQRARLAGLGFAELLRQHFPDFFLDHVATRKSAPSELFCTANAFLSLAHTQLIALDIERETYAFQFFPKEPRNAFSYRVGDWTARNYLADGGQFWLNTPRVRVHGLSMSSVLGNEYALGNAGGVKQHALALLIWYLLSNTRWSVMAGVNISAAATKWLKDDAYKRIILATLPIPRALSLPALCARLDQQRPLGLSNLGTIIAFLCHCTGNPYADTSLNEMRYGAGELLPIDWRTAQFATERANQKAAQQWATAYSRLATRLWADPALAAAVRDVIVDAARQAQDQPTSGAIDTYDPRWLGHHLVGLE